MARKRAANERRSPIPDLVGAVIAAVALVAGGAARRTRSDDAGSSERSGGPTKLGPFDPRATGVAEKPSGAKGKLVALAQRRGWGWLGRTLELQQRVKELHGGSLADAIALRAFVSLFPLLLLATAIAGFFAGRGNDVAGSIVGQLGLTGSSATAVRDAIATAAETDKASSIVGLLGLAWTSLGLVAALQYAFNQVWQVEDRGSRDKAVGFAWLAGASVLFVGTAAAVTVVQWVPGPIAPIGIAASLGATFLLWLWTSTLLRT